MDLDDMATYPERYENDIYWRRLLTQLGKAFKVVDKITGRKDMAYTLGGAHYPGQYRDGPGKMNAYLPGGREYTGAILHGDAPGREVEEQPNAKSSSASAYTQPPISL